MRLLFLFLFLINAAFIAWQYGHPVLSVVQPMTFSSSVSPIEMIVEPDVNLPSPEKILSDTPLKQCYTLGPFSDESQAQSIMQAIKPKVKEALLRNKLEVRHHRYWVRIAALKNRQAAIAVSKTLARKKIKDYYIVRGGERNNSISLGHFKEKKHADRRLKKLQEQGFDASIEPIYREFKLYWLDYALMNGTEIGEMFWGNLLPNGVARLKRDCN